MRADGYASEGLSGTKERLGSSEALMFMMGKDDCVAVRLLTGAGISSVRLVGKAYQTLIPDEVVSESHSILIRSV